jgi:hypothetical protein
MNALSRFDGVAWHQLGELYYGSRVEALEVLPGGDLVVGGSFVTEPLVDPYFITSAPYPYLLRRSIGRWNGTGWVPMTELSGGPVATLKMSRNRTGRRRRIHQGGQRGHAVLRSARDELPCERDCVRVGLLRLQWTERSPPRSHCRGSARRSRPPRRACRRTASALVVTGFGAAALPLSSILPQGGAGCFLLATPDAVGMTLPAVGTVASALAIPAAAGLIGQVFHQQVVPVELNSLGAITALTSTNRLTAMIGSF